METLERLRPQLLEELHQIQKYVANLSERLAEVTTAHNILMIQKFELERKLVELKSTPWVLTSERPPIEKDVNGDCNQNILFMWEDGRVEEHYWDAFDDDTPHYWMPKPQMPKPKRDFQKEILNLIKGTTVWDMLTDSQQDDIKARWESENL